LNREILIDKKEKKDLRAGEGEVASRTKQKISN